MTHLVTENCIRCKFMDCVEVCPVDCFYAGENFLVINPDECIDCGVCVPECPAEAIVFHADPHVDPQWMVLNALYAARWPNITGKAVSPSDAEVWNGVAGKLTHLSPHPHVGAQNAHVDRRALS